MIYIVRQRIQPNALRFKSFQTRFRFVFEGYHRPNTIVPTVKVPLTGAPFF